MKFGKRLSGALSVTALALGLVVLPSGGAHALGEGIRACPGSGSVTGQSTSTWVRTFRDDPYYKCGTVYVQARYAHVGGTSWTPAVSNSVSVFRYATNIYEGRHWAVNTVTFNT